jgi:hypothetical protein
VAPVLTGKEFLGNVKGCWYLTKGFISFQSSVPPTTNASGENDIVLSINYKQQKLESR